MKKASTRDMVSKARERLKKKSPISDEESIEEDKFPAAEIHTSSGAGREIIKRISAKEVDPKKCRPWKFHNRDVSWLNSKDCQDLVDSISKNGQMEPGLVRALEDDPDFDYEIIYGVRRWFACKQIPNKKYLVRITTADDKQCSVLMHVENADSKDITDLERACSFAQQLKSGIFKNQAEMGQALSMTKGHISKMVNAAEIFSHKVINELFPSKRDISLRNAYKLSPFLKNLPDRKKIEKKASEILKQKNKAPAAKILNIIFKEVESEKKQSKEKIIASSGTEPIISYEISSKGDLKFYIKSNAKNLTKKKISHEIQKVLEQYIYSE